MALAHLGSLGHFTNNNNNTSVIPFQSTPYYSNTFLPSSERISYSHSIRFYNECII